MVDDDWFARQVFADGLGREGFDVVCAEDALEALRCLDEGSFEVLVTDVVMPGMDGLELLDVAKRKHDGLEVIVMTSLDSVDSAVRAMRGGAWHYLVKPVSAELLAMELRRCLETHRLVREHQELQRYAELFEVAQRMMACLDGERLHALAVDALRARLHSEAVVLCTLEAEVLGVLGHRGLEAPQAEWLARTLYGAFPEAFLDSAGASVLANIGERIPNRDLRALQHAMVVPIYADGRQAAALLLRQQPYRPSELSDALFLAGCLATALANASRYGAAKESAFIDSLTGLRNAAAVERVLEREVERRRSTKTPFSVLFIDLDHLKQVNDEHGHLTGGQVLRELARLLIRYVREDDLLARYGGDEFVAFLRDAETEDAVAVAERIRGAIESHVFMAREGLHLKLTASIGVATWPRDSFDPSVLMHRADQAMYGAKRSRRNAVETWARLAAESTDQPPQEPLSDQSKGG